MDPLVEPRRLTRRSGGRIIGGVAGGLADFFGIEALVMRIVFAVLVIMGGAGLILYLLLWACVPAVGRGTSPMRRLLDRSPGAGKLVGAALIGVAAVMAASALGLWRPNIAIPAALVGLGIYLLRDQPHSIAIPIESGATTHVAPASAVTVPRPRRARSALGWLILAGVLVALGVTGVLDRTGALSLVVGDYPALGLLIVGVGLLIGAWRGRSRMMIAVGILSLPIVLAASIVDFPLNGRIGDRYFTPMARSELGREHEVLFGRTTFHLSDSMPQGLSSLDLNVAMGEVDVLVPRDTRIVIDADIALGQIYAFRETTSGKALSFQRTFGPDDAKRTLSITMHGGIASLGVQWRNEWVPPREKARDGKAEGPGRRGDAPQRRRDDRGRREESKPRESESNRPERRSRR
ncbi:MAG TPA: PspC domain-containing protein [Actinomycetota bacterium]|nr:PspC domain-containing protein [Actinomycetota bacterium]